MTQKKYTKPHILKDGTLVYPKKGWEPPPLVEGYRRKSDNPKSSDAWVLVPVWKDCVHRKKVQTRKQNCRCITFYHSCLHEQVGVGTIVNLSLCSSCPYYSNVRK